MSSDIAIRVKNLSKCYQIYNRPQDRLKQPIVSRLRRLLRLDPINYFREFWALGNISFDVKKGETVGIIGRNGSGKSTLLQLICGTLNPTAGSIQAQGRIAALLELGSGFNPEFTGRENIYMNASVLGLSKEEIDQRFDAIVDFADIGEFIEQPVKTYSSGMSLRLAFAVIAHVDADILIIDEALAVGDAYFTQKCMRFLRDFMKTGTVLFVSHDTGAVLNLCQRAVWLQKGVAKAIGNPKEIVEDYLAHIHKSNPGEQATGKAELIRSNYRASARHAIDQRLRYLNCSSFRNDIELFQFDPSAPSFGQGGAKIVDVGLEANRTPLTWCVGGEEVSLRIRSHVHQDMIAPIMGFHIKDRLGQTLFGDNTYLTYVDTPCRVHTGQYLEAVFTFNMPILPVGDYSINVAIAEGTQENHVQHHWIHDALFFKSHSSSVSTGLVGIPITQIDLRALSL